MKEIPSSDKSNTIILFLVSIIVLNIWSIIRFEQKLTDIVLSKSTTPTVVANNPAPVPAAPPAGAPTPSPTPAAPADSNALAKNVKKVAADEHIRGDKNAPISLIEYSDFECPFCKRVHPTIKQILDAYPGKVNWVYRHYPLNFHANAKKEAEASECAAKLGGNDQFWQFTDKIYERTTSNGTGFALDQLVPLAKEIGLNEGDFKKCLDSGEFSAKVDLDFSEGSAAGVNGTPGNILVNNKSGKVVSVAGAQPFEAFKQNIDQLLAE